MALFLVTFIVHSASPISTSFDSRWTIPTAISLLDHGDTNLDEYSGLLEKDHDYSVECVNADGTIVRAALCPKGHSYNYYPVAVPLLAAPVVWALRSGPTRLREWLALTMIPQKRAAFLSADFIKIPGEVEVLVASVFVGLTTVVIFLIGRLTLPNPYSALLALIFAFATSAWSTASRALWQHGPSILMLSIALYVLLRADDNPRFITIAALPVSFAFLLRPTNALFVMAVTVYVAMRYRRYLRGYLLCGLLVGAAFVIYNEAIYGLVLPTYFSHPSPAEVAADPIGEGRPAGPLAVFPRDAGKVVVALAGVLVSPSRGLLIYSPIFLFSIWGMVWALRTRWQAPLSGYLIAVITANWLLLGAYFQNWMGGHSYGPRLLSDLTPFFIFFLIPVLLKAHEAAQWRRLPLATFIVLLCVSVFIHSRGARSREVYEWNSTPANNLNRAWDWHDPQFLRGLHLPKWVKHNAGFRSDGSVRHVESCSVDGAGDKRTEGCLAIDLFHQVVVVKSELRPNTEL